MIATRGRSKLSVWVSRGVELALKHWYHSVALIIILAWCLPYFTSGTRVEWGDFSFFAQAYEAIRRTILDYHQFPWWNPWMSGGVPLYANPQIGVFSVQTLFVFIFGASIGLKMAIVFYTIIGYLSTNLLLHKYFKIEAKIAAALSVIWLFSSFFVAHLPAHFTFVWYMLAPLFIYLALTVKNVKSGLLLGLALAVMALSAIHNPFFHISLICTAIIATRLVRLALSKDFDKLKTLAWGLLTAGGTFLLIAGHRLVLTVSNVQDFPREVFDPAPAMSVSLLGPFLPFSSAHNLFFINRPPAPYGFGEITGTIGIFGTVAVLIGILFIFYKCGWAWKRMIEQYRLPLIIMGIGLICFSLGFGLFSTFSPYNILKHLPVFENMRVASRWFVFLDLALVIFIGLMLKKAPKPSFFRFTITGLLALGILEAFVLNFGYQNSFLRHDLVQPKENTTSYPFVQTSMFGSLKDLPNSKHIPMAEGPTFYREYEATLFNTGVLQSNDSLVDLNANHGREPGPRCPFERGCSLILTDNAKLTYWSPNKVVITRTGSGPIKLNMNNSNYFTINGKQDNSLLVAESLKDFVIKDPARTITIQAKPNVLSTLK